MARNKPELLQRCKSALLADLTMDFSILQMKCHHSRDLDLSPGIFRKVSDKEVGDGIPCVPPTPRNPGEDKLA